MVIAGMVWMTHWLVTMVVMATGTMVVMATEVGETSVCARVSGFFGFYMFCTP
jgi:hypothetical protein